GLDRMSANTRAVAAAEVLDRAQVVFSDGDHGVGARYRAMIDLKVTLRSASDHDATAALRKRPEGGAAAPDRDETAPSLQHAPGLGCFVTHALPEYILTLDERARAGRCELRAFLAGKGRRERPSGGFPARVHRRSRAGAGRREGRPLARRTHASAL